MSAAAPLQAHTAKPQANSNSAHAGLLLQRKCACGSATSSLTGECAECSSTKRLQMKLAIGASNDPLEQEADRVADQVLAAPAHSSVSRAMPRIPRFAGQATRPVNTAPASVEGVLASTGKPLERGLQHDMEQRFGHDFSRVRIHADATSGNSARHVNAVAYTVGHSIVFDAGRFAPQTSEGRRLIAHELVHVVQQAGVGGDFAPRQIIQRDNAKNDRRVFLEEGFTGRETEEEARLIARSKGWVVEGPMRWNGTNWVGENIRPGTGEERAIAQVQVNLMGLETLGGDFPTGDELAEGFEEGQSIYTGEESGTFVRKFGVEPGQSGESESGSKDAHGKEGRGQDANENELDPLTAAASLALDPESLAHKEKNTSGETGVPVGSKSGFVTGALAKVLTVVMAVLSFFTAPIVKGFQKLSGKIKAKLGKLLDSVRNKLRLRGPKPKALPAPLNAEEQRLKDQLTRVHGYTDDEVDALIREAREAPNPSSAPNAKGTTRRPNPPGAGKKRP